MTALQLCNSVLWNKTAFFYEKIVTIKLTQGNLGGESSVQCPRINFEAYMACFATNISS